MIRVCIPFVLCIIVGCGESVPKKPLPETVPVSGSVSLDGNPLAFALVTFIPTGETKGLECSGITDESGNYTLKQLRGGEGAPPGDYRVVISQQMRGDGTPVAKSDDGSQKEGTEGVAVEKLHPRYSDMSNSTLKATVPADGGEFPFELKSK